MNEEKNHCILRKELYRILNEHKAKVPLTMTQEVLLGAKQRNVQTPDRLENEGSRIHQGVNRLTNENTPEFMHLPLDYQGFCI
mmetsp:Transcript_23794/g.23569  ORF Transcript_23794/g.23569 Transcript_23794/m.23569 type:complete len:83 (-) Transcript_23794:685-933(-)